MASTPFHYKFAHEEWNNTYSISERTIFFISAWETCIYSLLEIPQVLHRELRLNNSFTAVAVEEVEFPQEKCYWPLEFTVLYFCVQCSSAILCFMDFHQTPVAIRSVIDSTIWVSNNSKCFFKKVSQKIICSFFKLWII